VVGENAAVGRRRKKEAESAERNLRRQASFKFINAKRGGGGSNSTCGGCSMAGGRKEEGN
jgi:hypothetical protein